MTNNKASRSGRRALLRPLLAALLFFLSAVLPLQAIRPDQQMQFADGLYTRGLYDLALDEYLRLTREAEDFERMDVVFYRVGECFRRLDSPQAAERFYLRLIREYPESEYRRRAEFRRAETLLHRGRAARAFPLFRAFLAQDPPDELQAPALYYQGYAARQVGVEADAEELFRRVLDDFPDSPFASYAALDLAAIYRDDPERAGDVADLYARVVTAPATPQVEAEALFQQAEIHFQLAEYEASATAYKRLLEEHPDSPRAADAALQAGWAFHNIGRYAEGATLAREALEDPAHADNEADWLYLLANCQRQLLRNDEAQATYNRLIETYPDHPLSRVATYEIALIAFRGEAYDAAIAHAAGLDPDHIIQADIHWLLAESYAALGRDDEAVQYYRLLLEADPEGEQAPKALYRVGRILQNRQDYAQAARTYRRLVNDFPDDTFAPNALFDAAFSMAMQDRYNEAIDDWERLLETYPEHEVAGESRYQQALALMQVEERERARQSFALYVEKHPAGDFAADAYYWIGVLQERAGRHAEAEAALRAALGLDPSADLSARVQYRLALNLQRQDQADEAAELLQTLLDTPAFRTMPLSLLEWLAVYRLDESAYAQAEEAGKRLRERADSAAWKQIAWSLYGRALLGRKQVAEAQEAFEQSLALDAKTREGAEAAWYLGDLHLEQDLVAEAIPYFEQAAAWATADDAMDVRARSYFGLGRAADRQEDWRAAARYYLSIGILFDDPELVPEALHRGAEALGKDGRTEEQQRALEELRERYPEWQ